MSVKIEDVKLGDKLVSDGTRDCIADGTVVEVFQQDSGLLHVNCNVGIHLLVADVHGLVPGFYRYWGD